MSQRRWRDAPPRGRPPWWPENGPFPPEGWRRGYRRPRPRFFVFALVAFAVFAVLLASFVAVLYHVTTLIIGAPPHPIVIALALLFLVFALTAGMRTARRIASPVNDLIDAAERVEQGDYAVRVAVRGPRQLRSLVGAFNAMSARLGRSEDERRRLLADVSHELRTPLTVMQGNVEALIDGVYPADRPHLETVLDGMRRFAFEYRGDLVTETMLVAGLNDDDEAIRRTAAFVGALEPLRAYVALPSRPPAEPWVRAPSIEAAHRAADQFRAVELPTELLVEDLADAFAASTDPAAGLLGIVAVHPMTEADARVYLARSGGEWSIAQRLLDQGRLVKVRHGGRTYLRTR